MSVPWTPLGVGVAITTSGTSATQNITVPLNVPYEVRIVNAGTTLGYAAFGATADNTGIAVPPNGEVRVPRQPTSTATVAVHVILASGTGVASAQPGNSWGP